MDKSILFLGPLYIPEQEAEIKSNLKGEMSNAPNVYQWNLLRGFLENGKEDIRVCNVLPVGIWKKEYRKLFLEDKQWTSCGISGRELGCVNLPFLKQWMRFRKTKKWLKKNANKNTEIIVYSAYMPFLKATYRLPKDIKITAIITDLPEFYDLGKTSACRKRLRNYQNRLVYRYLERVDRFVILTDEMRTPLHISERPYIRIEGLCNVDTQMEFCEKNSVSAILYSGTLHYQYGIKKLLNAFELIKEKNIELWICGSGEAENEVKMLSQKDERVKFFGFCSQEEVAKLRAKASVLVNPRTNEGEYTKYSFPSKTMEYLASGKPVVMYKLDGVPVEYDEYLYYVEDLSVEKLKEKLLHVLSNYMEAEQKAAQAKDFVRTQKSSKNQAKKIIAMIDGDENNGS